MNAPDPAAAWFLLAMLDRAGCSLRHASSRCAPSALRTSALPLQGALAPVFASISLFGLYLILKYFPDLSIQTVLNAYFFLLGNFALIGACGPLLRQVSGPLGEKSIKFDVPEGWLIEEDGSSITKVRMFVRACVCAPLIRTSHPRTRSKLHTRVRSSCAAPPEAHAARSRQSPDSSVHASHTVWLACMALDRLPAACADSPRAWPAGRHRRSRLRTSCRSRCRWASACTTCREAGRTTPQTTSSPASSPREAWPLLPALCHGASRIHRTTTTQ